MRKKTLILFMSLVLTLTFCLTGCNNAKDDIDDGVDKVEDAIDDGVDKAEDEMDKVDDEMTDKDSYDDDMSDKTEEEKIGDSSNLNQGVVEPGDEGVVGDATDTGKTQE